jgi:hypothetical protein
MTTLIEQPDDIKKEIILYMSYQDIINLCRTSSVYQNICEDDDLWKTLLKRDFPMKQSTKDLFDEMFRTNYDKYSFLQSTITDETIEILDQYQLVDHKYINIEPMHNEIFNLLTDICLKVLDVYTENTINDILINEKEIQADVYDITFNTAIEILTILSGLNKQYVGEYIYGRLDFVRLELDLKMVRTLEFFLKMILNELAL